GMLFDPSTGELVGYRLPVAGGPIHRDMWNIASEGARDGPLRLAGSRTRVSDLGELSDQTARALRIPAQEAMAQPTEEHPTDVKGPVTPNPARDLREAHVDLSMSRRSLLRAAGHVVVLRILPSDILSGSDARTRAVRDIMLDHPVWNRTVRDASDL